MSLGLNAPSGSSTAATTPMETIGSPTYTTTQHAQDVFHSTGILEGGVMSNNGDGTIAIATGQGLIRATDSDVATLYFCEWAVDSSVSLTDNSINYVYMEFVSTAADPIVGVSTSYPTELNTKILLGAVYRSGVENHLTGVLKIAVSDHASKMIQRLQKVNPFAHQSGATLSETGTRNIATTGGIFWEGLNQFNTIAQDSSQAAPGGDSFEVFYQDGGGGWTTHEQSVTTEVFTGSGLDDGTSGGTFVGSHTVPITVEIDGTGGTDTFKWTYIGNDGVTVVIGGSLVVMTGGAQSLVDGVTVTFAATTGHTLTDKWDFSGRLSTQIDNTQYDDGSGSLATLSNNKYGLHWVYIDVHGHLAVLFGQGNYTLSEAQDEVPPATTPAEFEVHVRLAGRIIIEKSSATFEDVETVFGVSFQGSVAVDHGGLSGLSNDDHTQYSLISSQAGVPSSTPSRVGLINIDLTNDNVYHSVDTTGSGDWKLSSDGYIGEATPHTAGDTLDMNGNYLHTVPIYDQDGLNLTAASGASTISAGVYETGNSGIIKLAAETGTADDLTDIDHNGALPYFIDGRVIFLYADTGDTITIKTTGNFNITSDITLTPTTGVGFIYMGGGWTPLSQTIPHAASLVTDFTSTVQGLSINNVVEDTSPQLGAALDSNAFSIEWSKGADVASATELLLLKDGNYFDITGTTTITTIEHTADAWKIGSIAVLQFDGILTFTHHATNLILPSAANITTAAGDVAIMQKVASGDWKCISYTRADGTALVSSAAGSTSPNIGNTGGNYAANIAQNEVLVANSFRSMYVEQAAFAAAISYTSGDLTLTEIQGQKGGYYVSEAYSSVTAVITLFRNGASGTEDHDWIIFRATDANMNYNSATDQTWNNIGSGSISSHTAATDYKLVITSSSSVAVGDRLIALPHNPNATGVTGSLFDTYLGITFYGNI